MHGDEAVNATKFRVLRSSGTYRYDPDEFHGPTLVYSSFLPSALVGNTRFPVLSESLVRSVPVLFGLGLLLLLPLLRGALGGLALVAAAFFIAVSPAMVFYSRYYIHETLLVFFTFLLGAALFRYSQRPSLLWALVAGAALGLMHATKETFVLAVAALGFAATTAFWMSWRAGTGIPRLRQHWVNGLWGSAAAALVSIAFFSSFFTNASGPLDSIRTYAPWLERAGGDSPHNQPWSFYWQRLLWYQTADGPFWTEGLIGLLALVGTALSWMRPQPLIAHALFARALTVYSFALAAIYTVISYKTPWCALGFWHGFILLAGIGAARILSACRGRMMRGSVIGLIAAGLAHLAWQGWRASFELAADRRNPYVYAHTSVDLLNLVEKINGLARAHPDENRMLISVIGQDGDYWPLPWYLRQFERVGWWSALSEAPPAPVMIASAKLNAAFDERPDKTHLMAGYFQLRPEVFMELYVEMGLWRRFVMSQPRPQVEE